MKNDGTEIIMSKEEREKLATRVEVLEKVKDLFLIPKSKYATIKQVADYYEISERYIKGLLSTNLDELESDGCFIYKGCEEFFGSMPILQGGTGRHVR